LFRDEGCSGFGGMKRSVGTGAARRCAVVDEIDSFSSCSSSAQTLLKPIGSPPID